MTIPRPLSPALQAMSVEMRLAGIADTLKEAKALAQNDDEGSGWPAIYYDDVRLLLAILKAMEVST